MKLSDYIEHLKEVAAIHGDLDVKGISIGNGGAVDARPPVVEYIREVRGGEYVIRFWNKFDGEEKKGYKVVRV